MNIFAIIPCLMCYYELFSTRFFFFLRLVFGLGLAPKRTMRKLDARPIPCRLFFQFPRILDVRRSILWKKITAQMKLNQTLGQNRQKGICTCL
jgi:hypothetical protein